MKSRAQQPHPLEAAFLTHCRSKRFFRPGIRVLVAVSGGVDSVVLLQLLLSVRASLRIEVGAAHLNHGLRGRTSDNDALFVRKLCRQGNVPFHTRKAAVARKARQRKQSVEEAARQVRYRFLDSTADRFGYTSICTAHHRNDQAETVLARVLKGTGWSGLSGIREKLGRIVRPLLPFSKDELVQYARDKGLMYRIDRSNRDPRWFRNRIRHELIPRLKKSFDPQVEKHLHRLASIAFETDFWLRNEARRLFARYGREEDGKIVLEIKRFNRYLQAQKQALLEFILERLLVASGYDIRPDYDDYAALLRLIEESQSGRKYIIGPVECVKTGTQLVFVPRHLRGQRPHVLEIEPTGSYEWPASGWRFRFSEDDVERARGFVGRSPQLEFIDRDAVQGRLVLRAWKAGDRFCPLGMTQHKKLSDFFADERVSLERRPVLPLLCDRTGRRDRIVWVCGYRLDHRYRITETTQRIVRMECEIPRPGT